MTNKYIGNIIKQKRIELGYSQEDLSKLMGFKSRSSIFKIEKGITNVSVEHLQKLSNILNINLEKIFSEITMNFTSDFLTVKMIINKSDFTLEKKEKEKLINLANNYFNNEINQEYFQDLILTDTLNMIHNYSLPFSFSSEDKNILDFCFNYGLIDIDYINDKVKFLNLEKFNDIDFKNYIDETFNNKLKLSNTLFFSNNKDIRRLQKEIIEITNKIEDIEILEDIKDIAKLKLNKSIKLKNKI
ncbi:helix-turn-helix domain-containing protein [Streptobacillus moniliformis]|uniref:helix-turn-helix domain-containing protein n=1 Tax=Streptobacillus moniliformis TaxID=34105 RepID=UPI0007E4751C|nr:helix-turn-helix transcriptional regulator [Streptobacillus moniliformis]